MMAKVRAETPIFAGSAEPHAYAPQRMTTFAASKKSGLLGLVILAYALVCATLLVRNTGAGIAAAALPGLAVALLPARLASTAALSRRATAAWILLIVAACPWQSLAVTAYGEVNAGSEADAAKFVVTALACLLAYVARVPGLKYPWPIKALLGYALITALGGLASTDPSSSLLRSARFAIVVIAVVWITSRLSRSRIAILFIQFSVAVSLAALMARAAHLPSSHLFGNRLDGYILPLQPNALGFIAAGGLICATALLAQKQLTLKPFALAAAILGITLILTESRTSTIGFALCLLVLAGPKLSTRGPMILGLFALALLVVAFLQTDTESQPLTSLLTHNGSTTTTATLGSRESEWKAALQINNTVLTRAVGQGLATKSVQVGLKSAQYAPVDGSWPATYLSAGLLGVLILAMAVLATARTAIRQRDDLAMMVIAYLIISSSVTDVFNDISVGLILFVSLGMSLARSSPPANNLASHKRLQSDG
jgi:hypothetical protein